MTLKIAAAAAAALTAAVLAAVFGTPPAPDADQDRTLTGCLRGGSSAAVFILRNASDGKGSDDYLLVAIPDSVTPKAVLNHRVAITGAVSDAKSGPPPPEGANAAERALPRLTVKALKDVAPNCSGG